MGIKVDEIDRKNALIDSSSTILLYKSSLLENTINYYNVIMTESVYDELTRSGHAGSNDVMLYRQNRMIHVSSVSGWKNMCGIEDRLIESLGRGERDTILLYLQGCGDLVILDDGKGAGFCKKNTIPYINALLVPRILRIAGILSDDEYETMTMSIIDCGRYSEKIIEYARTCSDEKLVQFV
jgi:predicted nucleic acid-binding protein